MHFVALRTISEVEFPPGSQGEYLRDGALKEMREKGFWDSFWYSRPRKVAEVLVDPNFRSIFLGEVNRDFIPGPLSRLLCYYHRAFMD
jgi:hypothetical protein